MDVSEPKDAWWKAPAKFASGGMAGILSKTCVAPLDRIKILNQTGASHGLMATFRTVKNREGFGGFWKGNTVNCIRQFPQKGILYFCSDFYKESFRFVLKIPKNETVPWLAFATGSMAGMTATFLTYPLDLIRGRMAGMLEGGSIRSVAKSVIETEGFRGFFRGVAPTVAGAMPYEGIKFGAYDFFRTHIHSVPFLPDDGAVANLICGAGAGAAASVMMFPNDTVRRMLQIQGGLAVSGSQKKAFSTTLECYVHTFKTGGITRFYRGLGPNLIRILPNTAIQFGIYEHGKKLISDH
eukprot:m.103973 g.103973  ORF g.103973 m.103973 type:complete len:296 (+) comp27539_c0_seq1:378-1265(+)